MRHRLSRTASRLALTAAILVSAAAALPAQEAAIPRPEHPRPDFRRPEWKNLNGGWLFRTDAEDLGLEERWYESLDPRLHDRINVPFPWESELSGLRMRYQGIAWYRKVFEVPESWNGKRIHIVFGAVDWEADVWLNGTKVGRHEGGYTPFECDLTGALKPSGANDLAVRVVDVTHAETPTGKQTGWYTPSSGIWQTVYLEARPAIQVAGIRIVPDLRLPGAVFGVEVRRAGADPAPAAAEVEVAIEVAGGKAPPARAKLRLEGGAGAVEIPVRIADPVLWEPSNPHLYEGAVSVRAPGAGGAAEEDRVETYFGLREVHAGPHAGSDFSYILLNGKPVYIAGTLDQAFHPDSLYSYPSDEVIRGDIERNLASGFNAIRLHIKVDDPRFYYWCDKLGCLVLYDLPNFSRYTERARTAWEATFREALRRDFNHPSIIAWVLFNETWGIGSGGYHRDNQEWVRSMVRLARSLDPTRLVEDNSPCNRDHVETDINSWHFYFNDYEAARRHIEEEVRQNFPGSRFNYIGGNVQKREPLINSEYGGIGAGSGDRDVSHCFHYLTTLLRREERVVGYIYTELMDIEWEHNGFYNYDRTPKEFGYGEVSPGFTLADLNALDFIGIDGPPIREVEPGARLELPVFVSHFSARQEEGLEVVFTLDARGRDGESIDAELARAPARWIPYRVAKLDPVAAPLPAGKELAGAITATLRNRSGRRLAANFIQVIARRGPSPRVEAVDARRVKLRFEPADYAAVSSIPIRDRQRSLLRIAGEAAVEYRIEIPDFVPLDSIARIGFEAELAAAGGDRRLDWPERRNRNDHPQTDGRKSPTTARILIGGEPAGEVLLEDAPSDLRGFISYAGGYPNGIHGYLARAGRESPRLGGRLVTVRIETLPGGAGLAVFGETMGRYIIDPAVVLELRQPLIPPAGIGELTAAREVLGEAVKVLLPTAEERAVEWRYALQRPGGDWTAPGFDDGEWKTGKAGFGTAGTPGAVVGTEWRARAIWLRARFTAAAEDLRGPLFLRLHHDEDVEVYLNGAEIFRADGYLVEYDTLPLPTSALAHLRAGANVIALHCRQSAGGQYIDCGVQVDRPLARGQ